MSKSSFYIDSNKKIHIINDNITDSGFITHTQSTAESIWYINVGNYIGKFICNVYVNNVNGLVYFTDYSANVANGVMCINFNQSFTGIVTLLICDDDMDSDTPVYTTITPSPTPTNTVTPTPTVPITPTVTPEVSLTVTITPTATTTVTPTITTTPTLTVTPTVTTTATPTVTPTVTPEVSPTVTITPTVTTTVTTTSTPTVTPAPTVTPTVTPTATPTPTVTPTATPTPSSIGFTSFAQYESWANSQSVYNSTTMTTVASNLSIAAGGGIIGTTMTGPVTVRVQVSNGYISGAVSYGMYGSPASTNRYCTEDSAFQGFVYHVYETLSVCGPSQPQVFIIYFDDMSSQPTTSVTKNGYTSSSYGAYLSVRTAYAIYWDYSLNKARYYDTATNSYSDFIAPP